MAAIVAAEGNGAGKEDVSPRDDSKYVAQNLVLNFMVSMAIKAIVELGIPDILSNAKEPMTAEQIVSELANKSRTASADNLRRLLRPLVREGVVGESLDEENTPVYSLTKISRWFTTSNENSVAPFTDLAFSKQYLSSWFHLKECILDDAAVAFELENGATFYDHIEKDVELRTTFQRAMLGINPKPEVQQLVGRLQQSGALDGVKTFMDLGGGHLGIMAGLVIAQNPHIHGMNFDLPSVITTSPPVKGVEHVGGDYFRCLPSADAIFMKFIIHNHGDEESIHILKNCFKALPSNGKVILVEYVFIDSKEHNPIGRFTEFMDLIMLAVLGRGKERTKQEYKKLLEAAGFSNVSFFMNLEGKDLILAIKE